VGGSLRLGLPRLSAAAVRRLSAAANVDANEVFAVTSGNPYFVTEVLAAGDVTAVPSTIADAVQARVARAGGADEAGDAGPGPRGAPRPGHAVDSRTAGRRTLGDPALARRGAH